MTATKDAAATIKTAPTVKAIMMVFWCFLADKKFSEQRLGNSSIDRFPEMDWTLKENLYDNVWLSQRPGIKVYCNALALPLFSFARYD